MNSKKYAKFISHQFEQELIPEAYLHGYIAFYKGKRYEVYGKDLLTARTQLANELKIKPKDHYKINIKLAEKNAKKESVETDGDLLTERKNKNEFKTWKNDEGYDDAEPSIVGEKHVPMKLSMIDKLNKSIHEVTFKNYSAIQFSKFPINEIIKALGKHGVWILEEDNSVDFTGDSGLGKGAGSLNGLFLGPTGKKSYIDDRAEFYQSYDNVALDLHWVKTSKGIACFCDVVEYAWPFDKEGNNKKAIIYRVEK